MKLGFRQGSEVCLRTFHTSEAWAPSGWAPGMVLMMSLSPGSVMERVQTLKYFPQAQMVPANLRMMAMPTRIWSPVSSDMIPQTERGKHWVGGAIIHSQPSFHLAAESLKFSCRSESSNK